MSRVYVFVCFDLPFRVLELLASGLRLGWNNWVLKRFWPRRATGVFTVIFVFRSLVL